MANKRMFSKGIIGSDAFREMPSSSQCLYFHLGMEADDDGFLDNYKSIQRAIGSSDDDFKILVAKRFILEFPNGICVVKHWQINNTIRKDRYIPTKYLEEKNRLILKENGAYTDVIRSGNHLATKRTHSGNPVESSIVESSIVREREQPNFFSNSDLQLEQIERLVNKGFLRDNVTLEIAKFISYWTEASLNGKQRWQAEKFFEIPKRLNTWFSRIK